MINIFPEAVVWSWKKTGFGSILIVIYYDLKTEDELREMAEESRDMLQKFVESFIQFPKPLVGVVNGPAIGIGWLHCIDSSHIIEKTFKTLDAVR